jgi:putative methionine-R-sulfoxide reductase with GAF domain
VGIYDVTADETGVIAWSGPAATLGSTRSEIVVPVLDSGSGDVVGLLGVKSDLIDAFGDEDRRSLEECAAALAPFWG